MKSPRTKFSKKKRSKKNLILRRKLKKILYDGSNAGIYKCKNCEECENGHCKRCTECEKRKVTIKEEKNVVYIYDKSADDIVLKKIENFYKMLEENKKLINDRKTILRMLSGDIHFDDKDKKNDLFGDFKTGIESRAVIKGEDDYENILSFIQHFLKKKLNLM